MMLAIALVLYCAGSALALKECKNVGCLRHEATGFTVIYVRHGADYVNFTAYVKTPADTWVGVGISNDTQMPETDSAIGARSADGARFFLDDRYNVDKTRPRYDDQQNLSNKRVEIIEGYTVIAYTRPIVSPDTMWDLDLDEPQYVLWAYGGGVTDYGNETARAIFAGHTQKGAFMDEEINLCDSDEVSDSAIEDIFKQCPLPTTDAAGHVTVSLISLVVIVLISVFTVSF